VVARAASLIADQQVRNRGTIGGSLAHGDPASDLPAVLLALDGSVTARGPNGDVQVPDVNGSEPLRYGIVKRVPRDFLVLHAVPYRRIIAPSGSIYVVDRAPGPDRGRAAAPSPRGQ